MKPLYVVSGDEALLVIEAVDGLRQTARDAGYTERETLILDARSDWSAVTAATQSVSLFGDRRLLEIRIPTGKPGKTGGDVLLRLAEQARDQAQTGAQPDTVIAVILPQLDRATRDARWAQALFKAGSTVGIPTISREQLPAWIGERLARQKQQADRSTLQWMADKVEGNLLAAHQEIQKLGLLYPEGALSAENVEHAVLNVARYDVFGLRNAMQAGDSARTLRMLEGLRAEGEALPLVLWSVTQAIQRLPARAQAAAITHAHDVDRLIKGLHPASRLDSPWDEMARLALRIAKG